MVEKSASNGEEATKERKGLWSPEEDERLYSRITRHGVSTWSSVAQLAGLRRSGKSCRLRWMNYLRPDLKKEPISKREEETIISLQKSLGNRWSVIAGKMPGRTDNEIKNYWNSRIRKRQQNTSAAAGCAKQEQSDPAAPEAFELAHPTKKEPVSIASTAPAAQPVPARFPLFACQLPGGHGTDATAAAGSTQSTTTQENNGAGSESEMSVGGGGGSEDAQEEHYYYGAGDCADMDMINLLSFDNLLMYPWDHSQLYGVNSGSSVD
ncbi:unnamed protein product [Alopecurus aequalis]